jgi:glycine hydroxymethyltransferase
LVHAKQKKAFSYNAPPENVRDTVLIASHSRRVKSSRLAPFAGYRMPLWFSSIRAEHEAVRQTAGLFDCTHMGVLAIQGAQAEEFLNAVTTNDVNRLEAGRAQYSYLLDAAGAVLDDIIVYCRRPYDYLMVVNAANTAKVKAWLLGLLDHRWIIDEKQPDRGIGFCPKIQDLAELSARHALVDIAIQGPQAGPILQSVTGIDPATLKSFHFREMRAGDVMCLLARTGYTGASMGFECFVARDQAEELWERLLAAGEGVGLLPCGLGARDSLRIEAGLPLYGHELSGPYNLSPLEAGYDWAVKLDKPFFIGKAAMEAKARDRTDEVVRLGLPGGRGIRPIRPEDAVLGPEGYCIGSVLSSATVADAQIALACVDRTQAAPGNPIGVYYLARNDSQVQQGRHPEAKRNDPLTPDIQGRVLPRFARF